jgi:hypothetical protein
VDFSKLPLSLLEAIDSGVRMQAAWLKVLSKRTDRYQADFVRAMRRRQSARPKKLRSR